MSYERGCCRCFTRWDGIRHRRSSSIRRVLSTLRARLQHGRKFQFGCGVLLMFKDSDLPLFRIGEADLSCSLPDDALLLLTDLATSAGGDPIVDGGVTMHSSDPGEEKYASKFVGLGAGDQMGSPSVLTPSVLTEGGRCGLAESARRITSVREAPLSSAVLKGSDGGDQLTERGCAGGGALREGTHDGRPGEGPDFFALQFQELVVLERALGLRVDKRAFDS